MIPKLGNNSDLTFTLYFCRLPKVYICEYCLKYVKSRSILQRHLVSNSVLPVSRAAQKHCPFQSAWPKYRKRKVEKTLLLAAAAIVLLIEEVFLTN